MFSENLNRIISLVVYQPFVQCDAAKSWVTFKLGYYSSIIILITTTVNKIISLDVHPPLTDNEMRILKILLAEHLDQLNENGVSFDQALSGALVLSKQSVVEGLHLIGQVSMATILGNKQGKLSLSTIIITMYWISIWDTGQYSRLRW